MSQLQVFIVLNVLPILIFAGAYLYYLQGKTKTRKKWLIIIGVLCVLITWRSFEIHKKLFPEIVKYEADYCIKPEPGVLYGVSLNPRPSIYHKIFDVKVIRPAGPPLCHPNAMGE